MNYLFKLQKWQNDSFFYSEFDWTDPGLIAAVTASLEIYCIEKTGKF